MKRVRTLTCLLLALTMMAAVMPMGAALAEANREIMEITVAVCSNDDASSASKWVNNPNDVVTPYIEEKFGIRIKEVQIVSAESYKERLAQWIASDTMPDIIKTGEAPYTINTAGELFLQLDEYMDLLPNYNQAFDQKFWPRFMNDGHHYQLPNITVNMNDPQYADDPYISGDPTWALWVREDILAQCGYTFTPIAEIQARTTDKGIKPTLEDLKIEPAIDTPEAYYAFLKKVSELDLKVGDKPVIPLSIASWCQFHFGSMFDWGHWQMGEDGVERAFLGSLGAKDYYWFINRLYQEKLMDQDFVIQKDEQLQEKIASGRVASGMYIPDEPTAVASMKSINPDAAIRYIPWPKAEQGKGVFDIYQCGGWSYLFSNKISDPERLMKYIDWFYSDEGLDILTWGPESAGLWKMEDGVKKFVDPEVEKACLEGIHGEKGADYYGLYDANGGVVTFWSKAANCVPAFSRGFNPKAYQRSYEPKLDILITQKALCGQNGMDYTGTVLANDGKENSLATSSYFWNQFASGEVAKLIVAENEAEFDAAWDAIYSQFLVDGKFEAAQKDMAAMYKELVVQ